MYAVVALNKLVSVSCQEQHGGGAGGGARGADAADEAAAGAEGAEATLKKREYVLRELFDTEEMYVSDLRLVCEGYIKHMVVRAECFTL